MASDTEQLESLARLHALFDRHGIEYWLFGGWAVDFHAESVTRPHDDVDLAVWAEDYERISELLNADGWKRAPEPGEDGYTGYAREGVRLELAFLARDEDGEVYTPLREGRGDWPRGAFGTDVLKLGRVTARTITLAALEQDKSEAHDDPRVAAKDRADVTILSGLKRELRG